MILLVFEERMILHPFVRQGIFPCPSGSGYAVWNNDEKHEK